MNILFEYGLAALAGFLVAKIFQRTTSPFFQDVIMANVLAGKKVTITIGTEATIFEKVGDRVVISRGVADFPPESGEN
jgi:hypothetical protein